MLGARPDVLNGLGSGIGEGGHGHLFEYRLGFGDGRQRCYRGQLFRHRDLFNIQQFRGLHFNDRFGQCGGGLFHYGCCLFEHPSSYCGQFLRLGSLNHDRHGFGGGLFNLGRRPGKGLRWPLPVSCSHQRR